MGFSDSWHTQPLLVIDTETTGVDPNTAEVVQLGGAFFIDGEFAQVYCSFVKPSIPIPAEATAVHGITDEKVAKAEPLDLALEQMHAYFADTTGIHFEHRIYAAYNAPYDFAILNRLAPNDPLLPKAGVFSFVDPLVWVRQHDKFVRGKGRHTLSETCKRHGIALHDAHNAGADAHATGRLLYKLLAKGAVPTGPALEFFDQQSRIRKRQDEEFQAWLAKQPKKDAP